MDGLRQRKKLKTFNFYYKWNQKNNIINMYPVD